MTMKKMNEQDLRQAAGGADEEDIPAGWTKSGLRSPKAMNCPEFVANSPDVAMYRFYYCQDCVNFTKTSSYVDGYITHRYYCTKGM